MSTTKRFCILILSALAFAAAALCPAQNVDPSSLKPQLGELDLFFKPHPAMATPQAAAPAWTKVRADEIKGLEMREKIRALSDLREYDTSKPPISLYWWNYPIYAITGFPRDLIDAMFGTVGNAPFLLNIPTTGAMYELVPTQIFMRNYHDWHLWPGRINANGHGWLDGTWGWWSNLRYTTFKEVDQEKLARWEAHNREVELKIADANAKTAEGNEPVKARRAAYLKETGALLDAGKHRDVIQRMIAYREVDPLNTQARALLVAALIADLHEIPERAWVDQTLNDLIWGSPHAVLMPLRDALKGITAKEPSEIGARYLVAVNMRLENFGQAMESAKELVALIPTDVAARRLQFEVALAGRDEDTIEAAAKEIEKIAGENSAATLHARGRQAFVTDQPEKAAPIYVRAIALEPHNPRFHYLEAMSLIELARNTGKYDKAPVQKELKEAIRFSRSNDEEIFYQQTLEAARKLKVKKPKTTTPEKKETKEQSAAPTSLFGS